MTSICLNMIVKNESHVIKKTLERLCEVFPLTYWVISDTGSTDDTREIIKNFFASKNIAGELVEHEWRDFGYNRTRALEAAYNKTDYLLIFDADDDVHGNLVLPRLEKDMYSLKIGTGFVYKRPLLVSNRIKWEFIGVLHEYLIGHKDNKTEETIEGDYYIESGKSGARSQDPLKYLKDAKVLETAYGVESDYGLKQRYAFYCAQSFMDANVPEKSIEWYKKVVDGGNWSQEKYYACLMIAKLSHDRNQFDVIKYLSKAEEFDNERIEHITRLVEFFYNAGLHHMVNLIYKNHKNYKHKLTNPHDKLFLSLGDYEYKLEHFASISSFYIKDLSTGYECCKKLINDSDVHMYLKNSAANNLIFYRDYIVSDNLEAIKTLFKNYNNCLQHIVMETCHSESWNIMFARLISELTKYNKSKVNSIKNSKRPKIMLTMTTCKRYDLFQKTINSVLNQWADYSMIDYWFCVDDNSSESDRTKMQATYPFFDYYFKSVSEKGHRESMNIIWNKLNELRPTYWIHMEDDFLFFDNMSYVSKAIKGLTLLGDMNVKQILFNRGYGEVIDDYKIGSYKPVTISQDFCLHDYVPNANVNYPNCHYWPHYSFRPSLIDVKTILAIGNFDSPNQFFEMDYAYKWINAGFKSAFFNKITNRHIGRLTSERNNKNLPNAYELNDESQFVKKDSSGSSTSAIDDLSNDSITISETELETNVFKKPFIKVINLERRQDRKLTAISKFTEANMLEFDDYEFIKGIDGKQLTPDNKDLRIFLGNDFVNRRGVIGCALTHYRLWNQLVNDEDHDFYLIMEDDFRLCEDFKTKLKSIDDELREKEFLFLGYHMYDEIRKRFGEVYNRESTYDFTIKPLALDLYIGGFFCYSVNKVGARKMLDYIKINGIKHGIDYLNKIIPTINNFEVTPQLCFSEWNEGGREIDSDIQNKYGEDDVIEIQTKVIAFHDNCLCERGTTVSIYNYAHYNETLLGNNSIILYDKNHPNNIPEVIEMFSNRFRIYGYDNWSEVDEILKRESCHILYLIKSGEADNKLSNVCKNVVHCVFNTSCQQGDVYARISDSVGDRNYPVVPHIVDLADHNNTNNNNQTMPMRKALNIPDDAIVFGRHGGFHQFDIKYVQDCVYNVAKTHPNIWFLFVNTAKFCEDLPNIIHINKIIDVGIKTAFINSCDAMIWGRSDGETFGLSIAEFSIKNKPVIATKCGNKAHVEILKDTAYWYTDYNSLETILTGFDKLAVLQRDWNMYKEYSPEIVMKQFDKTFIEPLFKSNLADEFIFVSGLDQTNFDLFWTNQTAYPETLMKLAARDPKCVGFNTLGFFKNGLDNLTASNYFKASDGIYIKKIYFEKLKKDQSTRTELDNPELYKTYQSLIATISNALSPENVTESKENISLELSEIEVETSETVSDKPLRIKMLCNWASSEQLCKEWSNMCDSQNKWQNIEMVASDDNIDYYVIINKPLNNTDYYDAKKTLVFQMEPWVYDSSKAWGVKTWGDWAVPDETKFMYVGSHKNYLNTVQWQINLPSTIPNSNTKKNKIVSFLSEKNFDEGHIKRIKFIKFLEKKNVNLINVYGRKNYHELKCYVGQLKRDQKESQLPNYKYCLSVENNSEENYATEKIWEGILCECLCFYWGCPNLENYIDSKAFVRLDLTDLAGSLKIIKTAIEEDWWSQRIDIIKREKNRIITELGFFPRLKTIIETTTPIPTLTQA